MNDITRLKHQYSISPCLSFPCISYRVIVFYAILIITIINTLFITFIYFHYNCYYDYYHLLFYCSREKHILNNFCTFSSYLDLYVLVWPDTFWNIFFCLSFMQIDLCVLKDTCISPPACLMPYLTSLSTLSVASHEESKQLERFIFSFQLKRPNKSNQ